MKTQPCRKCNLCEKPDILNSSSETRKVFCHVRSHKEDSFTVWRCKNCHSLHSLEPVDLEFYYSDYPLKNHTLDFHTRIGYKNRIRLLESLGVKASDSIIDVGCGRGLFVSTLKQAGFKNVTGYDFFVPEYSDRSVLEKKYDVVVSYDVIEHVEDPEQFFHMLKNLLLPGGLLLITTPNADEISLQSTPAQPELSQPFHRHMFSQQALLRMGERMSLKVTNISKRSYFDTLTPGVNLRFMWTCLNMAGGMLDSAVESPQWGKILRNPKLVFLALFGYFFRMPGNMSVAFRAEKEIEKKGVAPISVNEMHSNNRLRVGGIN